jgi:hypothetical protein
MSTKKGDLYGTHAPVLEDLLENNDIKVIVEDGGGDHSTPIFLKSSAIRVFTFEEDAQWADRLKRKFNKYLKTGLWILPKDWSSDFWKSKPDLVFIDGKRETRGERANDAFKARVPFVVLHDTEMGSYYHYDILKPTGYKAETYGEPKKTVVYTCED